jgi:hypothetical protein
MSDETYERMQEAVRQHVADATDGGYMSGFFLVAAAVKPETADATDYVYANHDGAPHEWLGLLGMAERRARRLSNEGDW